jgi:hypothetical protein
MGNPHYHSHSREQRASRIPVAMSSFIAERPVSG